MSDLRLQNDVEVRVDGYGNAACTRRWCFSNLSSGPVHLDQFSVWFDVTSQSVRLEGSKDSDGAEILATTSPAAGGNIRIECAFDKVIPPKATYSVEVNYRYNRYFRYLSRTGVWFLSEWFARFADVGDLGFIPEEPQHLRFELAIDDPRGKVVGRLLRTFEWDADPPPDVLEKRGRTMRLSWERNLRPDHKTEDILVAYRVGWIFEKLGPVIRLLLAWVPRPG